MTSPTDPNFNQKPIDSLSQNLSDQNQDFNSSWYFRNVRPLIRTTGYVFSETGGPIMTAGLFHGFARNISEDYLKLVRRYPSGSVVFLTGIALRLIGNSLIDSYSTSDVDSTEKD